MNATDFQPPSPLVWRVGALCRAIADALEARFNPVIVVGEISGFSRASSGHCYFSLKDESGQIRCAMFRRAASGLDFSPKDGELVELRGRLGVYEPRGDLQLIVESMGRAGQGALFEQFLKLKAQLEAQGLFDAARKRSLPVMPRGIGVVTSLGAAALHDVVTTLQRRAAHIPVVVSPATVQGALAPNELIDALSNLYRLTESGQGLQKNVPRILDAPVIDVILLVRGGGSMEDLWSFNDERLALVIAQSPVPIITGVGHETDFTIADFVADVRAPTPTAAAELVSHPQEMWMNGIQNLEARLSAGVLRHVDTQSQRLDRAVARLGRPSARLAQQRMVLASSAQSLKAAAHLYVQLKAKNLQQLQSRLPEQLQQGLRLQRNRFEHVGARLGLLDPSLVLQRGYAWVSTAEGATKAVTSASEVAVGQALRVHLSQGQIGVTVTKTQ